MWQSYVALPVVYHIRDLPPNRGACKWVINMCAKKFILQLHIYTRYSCVSSVWVLYICMSWSNSMFSQLNGIYYSYHITYVAQCMFTKRIIECIYLIIKKFHWLIVDVNYIYNDGIVTKITSIIIIILLSTYQWRAENHAEWSNPLNHLKLECTFKIVSENSLNQR